MDFANTNYYQWQLLRTKNKFKFAEFAEHLQTDPKP